jgi:hypothetical protein
VAAAYAELKGVDDTVWSDQIGYDIQSNSYCGAGAPRFNVVTDAGTTHFVGGCANDPDRSVVGVDRQGESWQRARFNEPTQQFPDLVPGTPITAIYLLHDEEGRSVIDNVFYNGRVMGKPGNGQPGG